MNLVRFMSTRELYRFLDGETISGNTEWRREGYASSSKGKEMMDAEQIWDAIRVATGRSRWGEVLKMGGQPVPEIEKVEADT